VSVHGVLRYLHPGLYGVVGTGLLWDVSTLCAVVPPAGLYGVMGTGVLWDVSTLCAKVPPPGLCGVVGIGLLCDVSTLCAVVPLSLRGALDDGSHPQPCFLLKSHTLLQSSPLWPASEAMGVTVVPEPMLSEKAPFSAMAAVALASTVDATASATSASLSKMRSCPAPQHSQSTG
jgi:hypothetical protein